MAVAFVGIFEGLRQRSFCFSILLLTGFAGVCYWFLGWIVGTGFVLLELGFTQWLQWLSRDPPIAPRAASHEM